MLKRLRLYLAAFLLMATAGAQRSQAETVTFNLTATVDSISDAGNLLSGIIASGDVFTGSLTYALNLVDQSPGDSQLGSYSSQPLGQNQLSFSSSTFDYAPATGQFDGAFFDVTNFVDSDSFAAEINGVTTPPFNQPGIADVLATVVLIDEGATAFSSDALPTALDLVDFQGPGDIASLEIIAFDNTFSTLFFSASATINSLEQVPEPSTFTLSALGLLSLAALGWRRRRRC